MYYNLVEKFAKTVELNAENAALCFPDNIVSYAELDKLSDQQAEYLSETGFESGDVLAILNTKQVESYAMMIACLKLGVAYCNLDVSNPLSRLQNIINRCKAKAVFEDTSESNFTSLVADTEVVYINANSYKNTDTSTIELPEVDGNTIAYIMFTSGSTGDPKGVAVTHQNVLHFSRWIQERYNIKETDNFANFSPMYFDNSVFDFYGALFNGASLTPIPKKVMDNPKNLVEYVDDLNCTIWFSVPSLLVFMLNMKVMTSERLKNIRVFTFGGEGFPKSMLKKLYDTYSSTAEFINVYGPTEGTCMCSSYDISEEDFDDMSELPSLGVINPNFSYQIDQEGFEKGIGELVIIGPNVAAGYYNDPERTDAVFGVFSEGKHYMNRYYKTGDLVTEREGLLYFKGRKDNQIKHMGYRIELEEIENALNKLSSVQECAVIYKRINDSYGKLFAFVAMTQDLDEVQMKKGLAEDLPSYMIPNKISRMDNLPKNANGKIDRKALKETV